jgi:hypothetical protein
MKALTRVHACTHVWWGLDCVWVTLPVSTLTQLSYTHLSMKPLLVRMTPLSMLMMTEGSF